MAIVDVGLGFSNLVPHHQIFRLALSVAEFPWTVAGGIFDRLSEITGTAVAAFSRDDRNRH